MLRRGLRNACFSRKKRQENGADTENYGSSKIVRSRAPYLFLVRKGPLGKPANPQNNFVGFLAGCLLEHCARHFLDLSLAF